MERFEGRTALITGGASGIGLALGRASGAAGMRVVLVDIEQGALDEAGADLTADGVEVHVRRCDVSDGDAVEALAAEISETVAVPHLVANNAGVVARHDAWGPLADWEWVLGVDLWGVVHGVRAFVPRMLAAGDEGHVVNTASTAGLLGFPSISSYVAAKHAVVGLSQSMFHELAATPVGVSVLCPGVVSTNIGTSERNRPDAAGPPPTPFEMTGGEAVTPEAVAEQVLGAVADRRFWVLPHEHYAEQAAANVAGMTTGGEPVMPMVRR